MTLERLKSKLIKDNQKELKSALTNLKKATKENILNYWYYSSKLTKLRLQQFKDGKITLEQVKELIKNKLIKNNEKSLNENLQKLEVIENATVPKELKISVEWKKSSWGLNPNAEMWADGYSQSGSIGGCGYDKLSTATAKVLNQSKGILKAVCLKKVKKITKKIGSLLGYGISEYESIPHFSGGVGLNCHIRVLENLGYNVSHTSGKTFDVITATYKGK